MTMIRPETEMKDSGVQWIGDIPNNWDIKPLYACLDEINQKNNPIMTTNILSLTNTDGVIPYSERGNQGNKSKENFEEYKVVYPDTIVANSMNILIGSVGLSKYEGCVSPVYYVYMAKPQVDIRYMNYLFQMEPFQKRLRQFANGILEIRLRVSSHDILHQKVAAPAYDEQQAIADYLDETCSQIDEIIAEAKASIDEYKNLRESLISNATTQGIKKNRCMKSSGVEWVLEIPSDWDMIPAKVLFSQSNERKHVDDVQLTASQKYGIISQVEYMKRENSRIVIATQGIENWKHVEPNDFIISLRSFQGGLEKSDVSGCITWHYVVLKANNGVYYDYFKWLFKSDKYINALQGTCNFIRNGQDLRFSNFVQVPLLVVPIEEQKEIADYLNKKVPKIDSLIAEKQSLIADLEAYKKSLIYEVVTGKRRVV